MLRRLPRRRLPLRVDRSRTRQLLGTRILFGIRHSSCVSQATWGQVLAYSAVVDGSDLVASERQAPWTGMHHFPPAILPSSVGRHDASFAFSVMRAPMPYHARRLDGRGLYSQMHDRGAITSLCVLLQESHDWFRVPSYEALARSVLL